MTQPDPKYVASDRPVNRRTAARQLLRPEPVNPVVQQRLAAANARNRLGSSLAEQIHLAKSPRLRARLHPASAVGALGAAAGAMAVFLAWLQSSVFLGAGGVAALVAGVALIGFGQRAAASALPVETSDATLFDDACLAALDRALDLLAPEVPDEEVGQLKEIKQLIVRIARQAGSAGVDENFTMEDRMYVTECVRRYLPDTLQSYLKVPQDQRSAAVLEGGQSAQSLLRSQLGLLRTELEKREAKMAKSAGEHLLRQQRFLQSKKSR